MLAIEVVSRCSIAIFGILEQSGMRLGWQNSVVLTKLFLLSFLASEGLKAIFKKGLSALLALTSLSSVK